MVTATPSSTRAALTGLLAALLVALGVAGPGWAQTPPSPQLAIRDLRLAADGTVELIAAVSPDVTEEEVLAGLSVRENGVLVDGAMAEFVERTRTVDSSAEVALLLDTSGSTSDNGALAQAQAAAVEFVERLAAQAIPVTLITFSTEPIVQVRSSTDAAALRSAILSVESGGETALYDAVDAAVTILAASTAEQRQIVLFTDGGDTASTGPRAPAPTTAPTVEPTDEPTDEPTPGDPAGTDPEATDEEAAPEPVATPPDAAPGPSVLEAVAARAAAEQLPITAVSLTTTETDTAALAKLANATSGVVLAVEDTGQLGETLGQVARSIASELVVRWPTLHPEAGSLEAVLVLNIDRGVYTSLPRSVANPAGARPGAGIPPPAPLTPITRAPSTLPLASVAEPIAYGAGALAIGILSFVVFMAPVDRRSARILKRQMAEQSKKRREGQPVESLAIRERLTALLESVPKPTGYEERIQEQLERAAWPLRTSEFVGMRIGLMLGGLVFGWTVMLVTLQPGATVNPVLPLVLGFLGWITPRIILEQRRKKRVQAFHEQMADTLQMLAGSLRAGYGLMQGIDNVASEGQAPTSTEFGRVLTEVRLGIAVEEALASMAERVGSEDFRWVTVAINIQRKVGGNLAELLDTVASTLREREQVRRQVQVLSAEGRLSAWVLIALPIVFALYLSVTQPEYLAPMFGSRLGLTMLGGAVVLMGLGVVWIRKVVEIDV